MKTALVFGAGGFIGSHMVSRLKSEGYWVRGVDIKYPEFSSSKADEFLLLDLCDIVNVENVIKIKNNSTSFDEIYQFAADMGGAGYLFTGENDANIMTHSCLININLLISQVKLNNIINNNKTKIFYSSSACVYPEHMQEGSDIVYLSEKNTYPAKPDSEYGWEKLFSERLFLSFNKNYNIPIAIARYHNVYGPESQYNNGKEKAPAAICRKIIESKNDYIEIWGNGKQIRSFLYIDDCIELSRKLMNSKYSQPVNIGSEEALSINQIIQKISLIENKRIKIKNIEGPIGVNSRSSDNTLLKDVIGDFEVMAFSDGIKKTYEWIKKQIEK